ncbi:MAG TPA: hypothetical protein VLH86_05420 [Patescibacteria group bacterium]|nr:hypothetical protein [Patescibacteria group bacterium]
MASGLGRGVGLFAAGVAVTLSTACGSAEKAPSAPTTTTVECGDVAALQAQADNNNNAADKATNYNGINQARAAGAFYGALAIAAAEKCITGDVPSADGTLAQALAEAQTARSASDYREATDDWGKATILAELAIRQLMNAAQTPHS